MDPKLLIVLAFCVFPDSAIAESEVLHSAWDEAYRKGYVKRAEVGQSGEYEPYITEWGRQALIEELEKP
jgi:hypothetical protein